jgi:hypothetical protein
VIPLPVRARRKKKKKKNMRISQVYFQAAGITYPGSFALAGTHPRCTRFTIGMAHTQHVRECTS